MPLSTEAVTALVWSVICFVAGVAWAAYRALSWVDRIRTWAHETPIESLEETHA